MRWYRVLALYVLLALPAQAETITLVADEWCPYNCEEDVGGFMVVIAEEIFGRHDIKVNYKVMPWTQAIAMARKGDYTGIIGATRHDAPDFIMPHYVLGLSDMRFWVRKNSSWNYDGLASLKGLRIGVIKDYSYGAVLDEYLQKNADSGRILWESGNDALSVNLGKLARGEIDVMPEDDNVMQHYIFEHISDATPREAGSAVTLDHIADNFLYIAFSPKNPDAKRYAAIIDEEMPKLRASGELQRILDLYRIRDWHGVTKE